MYVYVYVLKKMYSSNQYPRLGGQVFIVSQAGQTVALWAPHNGLQMFFFVIQKKGTKKNWIGKFHAGFLMGVGKGILCSNLAQKASLFQFGFHVFEENLKPLLLMLICQILVDASLYHMVKYDLLKIPLALASRFC